MDTKKVQEIIDKLVQQGAHSNASNYFHQLLSELYSHVIEYSKTRIGKNNELINTDCGINYSENTNERFFWTLGLISLEWTLRILQQKAKERHCFTVTHDKPCLKSTSFHEQLFKYCKETFEEVIEV